MPQHADADIQNRPPATLPRRSRTSSHEKIHNKRKKIEQITRHNVARKVIKVLKPNETEMWNQKQQSLKNNKTSTFLWNCRSQKKSSQPEINFEAQS